MNRITKTSNHRIYIWIIVILLVFNISTIGTIIYHNQTVKNRTELMHERRMEQMPPRFLRNDMRKTDKFYDSHKMYKAEYKRGAMEISRKLQEKRIELLEYMSSDLTALSALALSKSISFSIISVLLSS